MQELKNYTKITNITGESVEDGIFIDKKLFLTSSQFFYESGVLTPMYILKYAWMVVSAVYNLVSKDVDFKYFNTFKTIFEMDSGIFKYYFQYKNAFPINLVFLLRLKFADLSFRVLECMFVSGSNVSIHTLKMEINEDKHTEKILDTLPSLFTILKLTYYSLIDFISKSIFAGSFMLEKKTRYYKSPFRMITTGFFSSWKNTKFSKKLKKIFESKLAQLHEASYTIIVIYRNFINPPAVRIAPLDRSAFFFTRVLFQLNNNY